MSPQEEGGCAEGSLPRCLPQEVRGEGWSPTSPLGFLHPSALQNHPHTQHHAARNTGHCQGQARPGIQRVRNTVPIVMLPALVCRPKTTGHHPKPSAHCLPARRKPCIVRIGKKKATFCSGCVNLPSCPLLFSALCSGSPRDLAALPPGTTSTVLKTSPESNQKHSLLQLPFHSSMAGTSEEVGHSDTMKGGFFNNLFFRDPKEEREVPSTHQT